MAEECLVCNNPNSEAHHIVFRKQQPAMIECHFNKIRLCAVCHKGDKGPHLNRDTDIKYKMRLQEKLKELFGYKNCYTEDEIKQILKIPKKDAYKLVKPLLTIIENDVAGYRAEDIIRRAMGGRLYV
ncbi:hypothetical protein [Clostridium beijerinckii]|nr:hypothetical protein [Clostridium beijerinckii]MZK54158.1 hypothetical protein [Clostridium beijerinckii]MZK62254.1 hypothetical protein [Clostridium beijerinckii]MZK72460.1 hypothetical protein [Clostridium beijerinckii]MZK77832.1 hypothetical protein [Clostridium beijerinckii]MZK87420.1 hypothetical protein [Clostridium beijerinckii]